MRNPLAAEFIGPRRDRVSDLPSDLGVTNQAVSRVIDVLVSRGYVERSPDPEDRRRITLELTKRGQQVVDAVSSSGWRSHARSPVTPG